MARSLKRRRFYMGLAIAAIIGAASGLAFYFNLLNTVQRQSGDFLFRAAGLSVEAKSAANIVIVGIDDRSLEKLGHLQQWPRSNYARLIDRLTEARVVVFDVLFAELAPGDEEMAASIKKAGNVVLSVVQLPAVLNSTAQYGSFVRPLAAFAEGALATGHANVAPDADGVVRRLCLAIPNGDSYEPALALTAVAKYLRRPGVIESPVSDQLSLAGRSIPLDSSREMLVNYMDRLKTGETVDYPVVSFLDVMNGEVDPALWRDKIVIVGATAAGLGDTFWTPLGRMLNGVEIHARAVHTILTADFLRPAPPLVNLALILVLALLGGLIVLRLRLLWAILAAIFLCLAYFLFAFSMFDGGLVLNILYPPLTVLGTFVGLNLYSITAERAEKGEITRTFGRYISSSVVDKILAEGEMQLRGQEHEVTVAFADVRGFTSIAEKMPPDELVRVLNRYLSVIIDAVLEHDGMINKFGGDSVMAVWNVPVASEGHALLATRAMFSAQQAMKDLQEREMALPRMEFGIGINTGRAVAGNMGSEARREYSVVGDAVNTAARLAGLTPGGKVWIGADTLAQVKDCITARPLEPLSLKGKKELVQAYEVVAISHERNRL